ncbi:MAG: hypothetical protein FJX68_10790 [Alphaproteobacteria bacterium]|nr:hypothetical protein [Alphaproteobacteria bacterium]
MRRLFLIVVAILGGWPGDSGVLGTRGQAGASSWLPAVITDHGCDPLRWLSGEPLCVSTPQVPQPEIASYRYRSLGEIVCQTEPEPRRNLVDQAYAPPRR